MKVIGMAGAEKYLCEVSHSELEKYLHMYYYCKERLKALEIGQVVDLGRGYDYASEIAAGLKQTRDFIEANKKTIRAIIDGLRIESMTGEGEMA